jgi:hypothetical protein
MKSHFRSDVKRDARKYGLPLYDLPPQDDISKGVEYEANPDIAQRAKELLDQTQDFPFLLGFIEDDDVSSLAFEC